MIYLYLICGIGALWILDEQKPGYFGVRLDQRLRNVFLQCLEVFAVVFALILANRYASILPAYESFSKEIRVFLFVLIPYGYSAWRVRSLVFFAVIMSLCFGFEHWGLKPSLLSVVLKVFSVFSGLLLLRILFVGFEARALIHPPLKAMGALASDLLWLSVLSLILSSIYLF